MRPQLFKFFYLFPATNATFTDQGVTGFLQCHGDQASGNIQIGFAIGKIAVVDSYQTRFSLEGFFHIPFVMGFH